MSPVPHCSVILPQSPPERVPPAFIPFLVVILVPYMARLILLWPRKSTPPSHLRLVRLSQFVLVVLYAVCVWTDPRPPPSMNAPAEPPALGGQCAVLDPDTHLDLEPVAEMCSGLPYIGQSRDNYTLAESTGFVGGMADSVLTMVRLTGMRRLCPSQTPARAVEAPSHAPAARCNDAVPWAVL